jgi:hypothetical protein
MSDLRHRTSRKVAARLLKLAMIVGALLAAAIMLGLRFYSAEHSVNLN